MNCSRNPLDNLKGNIRNTSNFNCKIFDKRILFWS